MIRYTVFILLLLKGLNGYAQTTSDFINQTSLDSLVKTVRQFSGEDSCVVGGVKVKIINRVSSSGNDLAADYLVQKFTEIGQTPVSDVYSQNGRNVYAKQIGALYPDSIVMICAHYDAVADYCADDNASGVGIVLEAARILGQFQFQKTIVFALWDEEEIGLIGAKNYAGKSYQAGDKYVAVLNIDMAAYDSNDDRVFDIDLNSTSGSGKMKDRLVNITATQNLNIIPEVVKPGTSASDHSAFWDFGYPAVLMGESWETSDQNSKYHTAEDRIALFNLPYYHEIAKLAVGFVGELATPVNSVSVAEYNKELYAYIDPVSNQLLVEVKNPSLLKIYNLNGALLFSTTVSQGRSNVDVGHFSSGVYLVKATGIASKLAIETKVAK